MIQRTHNPRTTRRLALIAIAGISIGVVAILALHLLDSGHGPVRQPLSFYARGVYSWLWQMGLIAIGVGVLALARGVASNLARRSGAGAVAFAGISLIVVALFPTDAWFPWERRPTATGAIHSLAAGTVLVALTVAMFLDIRLDQAAPGRWRELLLRGLGLAYIMATGVSTGALAAVEITSRQPYFVGLAERALMGIALTWLVTLALMLLRLRSGDELVGEEGDQDV